MRSRWLLLLALALPACHRDTPADEKAAPPAAAETDMAKENGIVVAPLEPATHATPTVIGFGTIVDVSDLFATASQYATAESQRRQFASHLDATRAELERSRALNADNKNISDRALQDAAAAAEADAAQLRAAEASLVAIESAARQKWGPTLAAGAVRQSSWARSLLNGQASLLELAFQSDATPPATVTVRSAGGRERVVHLLGAAPRVDARLQHAAFDYLATPASEFPVGLSVEVLARPANATNGALVPSRAVVWDDGAATVFVETSPEKYEPKRIAATTRVDEGFVENGLAIGTRVVVEGAQQLLSERHKPAAE
ncbi:MAG: hypothetical protein JOZ54_08040 [Acidobacteria bacterium]|nr:hypothetical protein [Acidobacteriota bacterium]